MPKARTIVEGTYIPLARKLLYFQTRLKSLESLEKSVKTACAHAMQAVSVRSFSFVKDKKVYEVVLERPYVRRLNVSNFFELVQNGTVSLKEFLENIEVSCDRTQFEALFGDEVLAFVDEVVQGPYDLVISRKC